jgi:hypothetical protein
MIKKYKMYKIILSNHIYYTLSNHQEVLVLKVLREITFVYTRNTLSPNLKEIKIIIKITIIDNYIRL